MPEILVIDDMKANASILALMLNEIGFDNVVVKHSGIDTLDYLQIGSNEEHIKKEISMIFLDLMMPEMNGDQVCETIRSEKMYRETPIIITTGLQVVKSQILAYGATDYLLKPITIEEVCQMTEQYIKV